jgi:hypothetical protein
MRGQESLTFNDVPGNLSGSLWATHFQFLNDTSEMQYGLDGARAVANAPANQVPDEKRRFLRDTEEILDHTFEHKIAPPYVFSFCGVGDLLGQWREYGGGGSGFSIAFDYKELSGLFDGPTGALPITYDPTDQRDILSATVEAYWETFLRWEHRCEQRFCLPSAPEREGSIEDHCQYNLVSLLVTELATFKNPGFKEEREWRLFRWGEGSSPRKFRTGRFGVIPYIELSPPQGQKLPIKKVIQGPTADRSSAKRSVKMLLEDFGYAGVEVEVSTIPLR